MEFKKNNKIIIFAIILVLILLTTTIGVFIYLDSIKHIGVWKHELKVYDENNHLIRDELLTIEFKEDNTFIYILEDKFNNSKLIQIDGTYKRENKNISLIFEDEQNIIYDNFYLKKDNLYFYKDNKNKFLTKGKINVLEIPEIYTEITYNEYLNLLSNKEKAIIVAGRDTCYYCVLYKKSTLIDAYSKYNTSFYHIDSDENWDNLGLNGTPTTYLLKNGEIVGEIFGYVDYKSFTNTMEQYEMFK